MMKKCGQSLYCVTADQWFITEGIANEFGILNRSVQSILKEMAVQNLCHAFWQMTIEIGNVIVALVNSTFLIKVLKHLRNAIWQTNLVKWENNWILDRNSVPCYVSLAMQQFLQNNKNSTILQPPYSSGFTPYSFWLYLRPKNVLKVCCFHVQQRSTECDGRFHSHAERTLLEVPRVVTELEQDVCMCACVCTHVCTHKHTHYRIRALHFCLRDCW
jgi:hypothetical protein